MFMRQNPPVGATTGLDDDGAHAACMLGSFVEKRQAHPRLLSSLFRS
jgi:hypothetical protein